MWAVLTVSALVLAVFASRLEFEEDITKLLPQTEKASRSGLAFGQLSVKDKIFVQIEAKAGREQTAGQLAQACDEFVALLQEKDTATAYMSNVLYRIEPEWLINGLDYALMHFPGFVDSSSLNGFDALLEPEALDGRMQKNVELMADDWEGNITTLICYDPAALRYAMLEGIGGEDVLSSGMGFKVLESHLFTPDSTAALAFIAPSFKSFDSKSASALVGRLEKCAEQYAAQNDDVDVIYHGATVLSAGNSRHIKGDLVLTILVSMFIILTALLLCFKNKSTLAMLAVPVLYGILFAMTCIFLMKGKMSLMALGLGAIVLGIAISYTLHVLTHYKYVSDPEKVIREQATPVCLGCLTTIGAFAGLLFTQSELLRDFGTFASIALIGSTFFSLAFLPQFFNPEKNRKNEKAFAFLDKVNSYPVDKKPVFVGILVALIALGTAFSWKVGFDTNLQNISYVSPVVARSQAEYAQKVNGGLTSVYYAASAPSLEDAMEYSRDIDARLSELEKEGLVKSHSSLSKYIASTEQQDANIAAWKAYWTESKIAYARRNITDAALRAGLDPDMFETFYTLVEADYSSDNVLESGIVPVELSCNIAEKVGDDYLVFMSAIMDPSSKKAVGDAVSALPHALVVDPFYYTSDMVEIIHQDFNMVLMISSIFVLLVLLLSFRNVIVALIAFLPMFFSWFVVEGYMALLGLEFNLINIVISSFVFGVGVDYSIFIMDGLLAAAKGEDDHLLGEHKTAISLSAFTLIVVVASLLLAKSPSISSVGICTIIGMASTILISYCLQPLIFRLALKVPALNRSILKK